MSDIENVRLLAGQRAADDPMAAYALDGCADEIEYLRKLVLVGDVLGTPRPAYQVWSGVTAGPALSTAFGRRNGTCTERE